MIVSRSLVKVGHRQAPHKKTPELIHSSGVFAFYMPKSLTSLLRDFLPAQFLPAQFLPAQFLPAQFLLAQPAKKRRLNDTHALTPKPKTPSLKS
jgi:hypothetical protein